MYKTAIIGLGNISQGYDSSFGKEKVLTHIKAYKNNPNFIISGVYDKDYETAIKVAKKWNINKIYINLGELIHEKPDIISICTPDDTHLFYLKKLIKVNPKFVLCEKPIAANYKESKLIVSDYYKNGIKLGINYSRRWLKEIQDLKLNIEKGYYRKILSASIKYYGGFLHNCSHLIDLLQFIVDFSVEKGTILKNEKFEKDSTVNAISVCKTKNNKFVLQITGYDHKKVNPLILEIVFENKKIIIEESSGLYIHSYNLIQDNLYKGYYYFKKVKSIRVKSEKTMKNVIDNVDKVLKGKEKIFSDGNSALKTLKLCEEILKFKKI